MIDKVSMPVTNVLTFYLMSFNVHVCVVYRAPSNSQQANDTLANFILDFCSDKEVVLLGDFNLPNIDLTIKDSAAQASPIERMFIDVFISLGLTQGVKESTFPRSGNTLDLIFTSDSDRAGKVQVLDPLPGCDHCPTMIEYVFSG